MISNTFWKRDSQNVPLANLYISKAVEKKFTEMKLHEPAEFCRIIRNFFGVFDVREWTVKQRRQYLKEFEEYFIPKVLPDLLFPVSTNTIPTFICGLPVQTVEDMTALLFGYYHRDEALVKVCIALLPEFDEDEVAMYVERCIQTNDVENLFNMLKAILKREGRGSDGRSTPLDLELGIKKLISNTSIVYDRNKNFSVPLGNKKKIYEDKVMRIGEWGKGKDTSERPIKKRKQTVSKAPTNEQAVTLVPTQIRKFHKRRYGEASIVYKSPYANLVQNLH